MVIRDLLAYRLHRVANRISASAALRYRREFGVSLAEWRTVALLGAEAPLSLNDVAKAAGVDKSQMSRVVAALVARGIAARKVDRRDRRGVRLTLTAAGRRLYKALIAAAGGRNTRLLGCLTTAERKTLDAVLTKLDTEARRLAQQEKLATRA